MSIYEEDMSMSTYEEKMKEYEEVMKKAKEIKKEIEEWQNKRLRWGGARKISEEEMEYWIEKRKNWGIIRKIGYNFDTFFNNMTNEDYWHYEYIRPYEKLIYWPKNNKLVKPKKNLISWLRDNRFIEPKKPDLIIWTIQSFAILFLYLIILTIIIISASRWKLNWL